MEVDAAGFQRNWVIYDSADQLALVREIMKEMQLDEKRFSPRAVLAQIGNWKNDLLTPELVSAEGYMQEICDPRLRSLPAAPAPQQRHGLR